MRVLVFILALVIAWVSPGCIWRLDDDLAECSRVDGIWPRCTNEGLELDCVGGSVVELECPAGTTCLAGEDPGFGPWTVCASEGSGLCDWPSHTPLCSGLTSLLTCQDPGYLLLIECDPGLVCKQSSVRAACTEPDTVICDPATASEWCDEVGPAFCDAEFGMVAHRQSCGPDEACAVGAQGPVCTDPGAEACDWQIFVERCDGLAVVACDAFDWLTERRACDPGERCRESEDSARCFPDDQPDCDPLTFSPTCEGNQVRSCNSFGVQVNDECPPDQICSDAGMGPQCVDPQAELCDPQTFVSVCDEDRPVVCDADTHFTRHLAACDTGQECRIGLLGAVCADANSLVCDPETSQGACADDAQLFCNAHGFTQVLPCPQAEICVMDDVPFFCDDLPDCAWPVCVNPGLPTCPEPSPVVCEGRQATVCTGGYQVTHTCEAGTDCVTEGGMWLCLPIDTPTCDPLVVEDHCEGNSLVFCFGNPARLVEWPCGEVYACIEGADGAACELL